MKVWQLIEWLKKEDCPPEALVLFDCKKCGRVDVATLEVNDRKSGRATARERVVLFPPGTAN